MDFNQWMKVFEMVISLLQAIIWPLILVVFLLILRVPLQKFLNNVGELTLKAGPFETTAKRQQILEVSTSLGAASAHWRDVDHDSPHQPDAEKTREIAKTVEQLVTPTISRQLEGATVLWVDDIPLNNTYERQALAALGIQFTISKSTENALKRLSEQTYDVIISDMARPLDQHAGYTLLEKVQAMHITTPYIIYAGSKRPEHIAEAQRRGAFGTTNDPQELFEMVIRAIRSARHPAGRGPIDRARD